MERLNNLAKIGTKYYNMLHEFYESEDICKIISYVIEYAEEEAKYLGKEKDDKVFDEKVAIKGYKMMRVLYQMNVQNLREGKGLVQLLFPTIEQTKKEIKDKYNKLVDRLK